MEHVQSILLPLEHFRAGFIWSRIDSWQLYFQAIWMTAKAQQSLQQSQSRDHKTSGYIQMPHASKSNAVQVSLCHRGPQGSREARPSGSMECWRISTQWKMGRSTST